MKQDNIIIKFDIPVVTLKYIFESFSNTIYENLPELIELFPFSLELDLESISDGQGAPWGIISFRVIRLSFCFNFRFLILFWQRTW